MVERMENDCKADLSNDNNRTVIKEIEKQFLYLRNNDQCYKFLTLQAVIEFIRPKVLEFLLHSELQISSLSCNKFKHLIGLDELVPCVNTLVGDQKGISKEKWLYFARYH